MAYSPAVLEARVSAERQITLVVNEVFDEYWEPGDVLKYRRPRVGSGRNPFGPGRLTLSNTEIYDPEHWRVLGFIKRYPYSDRAGLAILRSIEPIVVVE